MKQGGLERLRAPCLARSTSKERHPMRPSFIQTLTLAMATVIALGGCSNRTATFPGHSDPEVWNAMVTVAENPVYDDWYVFENEVMTARSEGRIEILRILRRDLVRVGQDPVRQTEDWQFYVQFMHTDPPTIKFTARHVAVPAHLWREADRYFSDMRTLLERDRPIEVEVVEEEVTSVVEVQPSEEVPADESGEESTAESLGDLLDPE